jgi:hypothetical protein
VQYNHQWQAAIDADRATYDRQTVLLHAALARQAIRDALATPDDAGFRRAVARLDGIDPSAARAATEGELRRRESDLSRTIHDATDRIAPVPFVHVERPTPHLAIVRVPVYSDIADEAFLRDVRAAVEEVWRVRDGEDEVRIEMTITHVAPERLYGPRPPPARGAVIDLHAHVALFPADGAVLTTGAALTHVAEGRCIALGPHDVARHVLAHEFGHVLGFRDVYFRGYRDLGADGYEVTEVVAEPDDIMGAPGSGPVLPHRLETLIREVSVRQPAT